MKEHKQIISLFKSNYGIGSTRATLLLVLCGLNLNFNLKIKDYYKMRLNKRIIKFLFQKSWILNDKLQYRRQQYFIFIRMLLNYYKYLRLKFGLPVRGQRTHSNRQTVGKVSRVFLVGATSLIVKAKKKRKKLIKKKRIVSFGFLKFKKRFKYSKSVMFK